MRPVRLDRPVRGLALVITARRVSSLGWGFECRVVGSGSEFQRNRHGTLRRGGRNILRLRWVSPCHHSFKSANSARFQSRGHNHAVKNIGAPRFELGTSPTRTVRATRLRHAPNAGGIIADLRSSQERAEMPWPIRLAASNTQITAMIIALLWPSHRFAESSLARLCSCAIK